jgi:hypothetical protein
VTPSVGTPHSYGSNFWGLTDFGAIIPEMIRTAPTKIAPIIKKRTSHSLLIKNSGLVIKAGQKYHKK